MKFKPWASPSWPAVSRETQNHVVMILTAGASGSTLLSLMLNQHPQIDCPPELHLSHAGRNWVKDLPDCIKRRPDITYKDICRDYPPDRRLIMKHTAIFNNDLLSIPKFIWLYRHPIDWVQTTARKNWKLYTEERWIQLNMSYFMALNKHGLTHIRVKFEDFITNTENVIKQICQFIKLPFDEKMLKTPNARVAKKYTKPFRGNTTQISKLTPDPTQCIMGNKIQSDGLFEAVEVMKMDYE